MSIPKDPQEPGDAATAWIPLTVLIVGVLLILGFVFRFPWWGG